MALVFVLCALLYEQIPWIALWDASIEIVHDSETVARINGVASAMKTFSFLFSIKLGEMILRHSDNLSRTLQHKELSASECQVVAQMTVRTLETTRTDASYDLLGKIAN